ncbi:hypothetical protein AZE42_03929 [Rhizopogon vesiculosus]|uniref:Uncharacterized protein n=1 Tax=Rhizopogon vesiculosus TaxID=180088 RepID=A0A1J8QK97_9AGAM|nr:hypothetical protein AZE42_03929 [Rhizopogon vesiculosus]
MVETTHPLRRYIPQSPATQMPAMQMPATRMPIPATQMLVTPPSSSPQCVTCRLL